MRAPDLITPVLGARESIEPLRSRDETGDRMHQLIDKYSGDLWKFDIDGVPMPEVSLPVFFDFVRGLRYRKDNKPIEVVARPKLILENTKLGYDCKKKTILVASYLRERKIPFRLVASSKRKDGQFHHVFCQAHIGGEWRNVDATYPDYTLYAAKPDVTAAVEI